MLLRYIALDRVNLPGDSTAGVPSAIRLFLFLCLASTWGVRFPLSSKLCPQISQEYARILSCTTLTCLFRSENRANIPWQLFFGQTHCLTLLWTKRKCLMRSYDCGNKTPHSSH